MLAEILFYFPSIGVRVLAVPKRIPVYDWQVNCSIICLMQVKASMTQKWYCKNRPAWLFLVGKGYIFFLCGIPLIFCIMTLQSNTGLDSTAWMPNPSWVLTEMKYETTSDDRKEVRATSFCAIKFYPNKSPGRSKYTKPSTKTTYYLKG